MTTDHTHPHTCAERPLEVLPRRGMITGLLSAVVTVACRTVPPVAANSVAPSDSGLSPALPGDEDKMRIALREASEAKWPFGAVIVRDGNVIAQGHNLGGVEDDPTAHGEMVAIRRAIEAHGSASLRNSAIYTTGEPCPMCMGAILWCGFGRLIYALSIERLSSYLDQVAIPTTYLASRARFAKITITGGVLAKDAGDLFARLVVR